MCIRDRSKGATNTVQRSVKTAEQTAKTSIKTTKEAAVIAQKTAKTTAKATQKAAQAAKKAAKATAAVSYTHLSRMWKQDTDLSRWEVLLYRLQTNSLRTRNFIN